MFIFWNLPIIKYILLKKKQFLTLLKIIIIMLKLEIILFLLTIKGENSLIIENGITITLILEKIII